MIAWERVPAAMRVLLLREVRCARPRNPNEDQDQGSEYLEWLFREGSTVKEKIWGAVLDAAAETRRKKRGVAGGTGGGGSATHGERPRKRTTLGKPAR